MLFGGFQIFSIVQIEFLQHQLFLLFILSNFLTVELILSIINTERKINKNSNKGQKNDQQQIRQRFGHTLGIVNNAQ